MSGLFWLRVAQMARLQPYSDDLVQAVTGHKSAPMVAKYAGRVRQTARARAAQSAREQNGTEPGKLENGLKNAGAEPAKSLEAGTGIEPVYTDLQSAA